MKKKMNCTAVKKVIAPKAFIFLLLLSAITSCMKNNWETYDNGEYSIQYPPEWTLDTSGNYNTAFFLSAPLESSDGDFRETISFTIDDLSGYEVASLDKSTERIEASVESTNVKLIDSKRIKTKTDEYHLFIFDCGEYMLESRLWVNNSKDFRLNFFYKNETYNNFKEVVTQIFDSFTFKDKDTKVSAKKEKKEQKFNWQKQKFPCDIPFKVLNKLYDKEFGWKIESITCLGLSKDKKSYQFKIKGKGVVDSRNYSMAMNTVTFIPEETNMETLNMGKAAAYIFPRVGIDEPFEFVISGLFSGYYDEKNFLGFLILNE